MSWSEEHNFHRAAAAGIAHAELIRSAGPERWRLLSHRERQVVEARVAAPVASWREIGERLGMTKFAAASLFRRAKITLERTPK
jgi:DNA-binding transcriptional regulator WhiA